MAQVVNEKDSWDKPLTTRAYLTFAKTAMRHYKAAYPEPWLVGRADLRDGTEIEARSLFELEQDLNGVDDTLVTQMRLNMGADGATTTLAADTPFPPGLPATTRIRTEGTDSTKVYGIHGELRRDLRQYFETQELAKRWSPQQPVPHTGSMINIHGDVGNVSGGNTAVSEIGPAFASSDMARTSSDDPKNWWVTLGAPLLVAVSAALLVYLIIGR